MLEREGSLQSKGWQAAGDGVGFVTVFEKISGMAKVPLVVFDAYCEICNYEVETAF